MFCSVWIWVRGSAWFPVQVGNRFKVRCWARLGFGFCLGPRLGSECGSEFGSVVNLVPLSI